MIKVTSQVSEEGMGSLIVLKQLTINKNIFVTSLIENIQKKIHSNRLESYIYFFFHGLTGSIQKFPGQRLNLATSDPLTQCTGLGIEPAPLQGPKPLQSDS